MSEARIAAGIAADDPVVLSAASADAGAMATGPVQPGERMQVVDVLRGFALLGILQVNWWWNWGPESVPPILRNLLGFFVDGSFYTTFSFLFGLGFAIQLIRAEEANRPFVLRYLWRLLIMFFIGAAHEIFIWGGDIVKGYALAGVMLLVVCRFRAGLIVALAAAVLVLAMAPRLAPDWRVLTLTNPEQIETVRLREQARSAAPQRKTLPYGQFVQAGAIEVWELVTGAGDDLAVVAWRKMRVALHVLPRPVRRAAAPFSRCGAAHALLRLGGGRGASVWTGGQRARRVP